MSTARRHPVIGITGPDRGGFVQWLFLALAVRRAGGRPVRIRPGSPREAESLDGLLIGGGADVEPARYGGEAVTRPAPTGLSPTIPWHLRVASWIIGPLITLARRLFSLGTTAGPDPARDALEDRLLTAALDRGLPVLGICRGAQMLNVHCGGTLHQDIRRFYGEAPVLRGVLPVKEVTVAPGSRLARLLGPGTLRVNALHKQAVNRPGPQVEVVAVEEAQIPQAIEVRDRPLVLGVQWHPEFLPHLDRHQLLFHGLIDAARKAGGVLAST